MKKLLLSSAILLTSVVLFQSCQKEIIQSELVKETTIDTTVSSGSNYLLKLAPYGDEGAVAKVVDLPSFASISRMENETDMFTSVYHYKPTTTGIGQTDHITVSVSHCGNKPSTLIYLNISIKK